MLPRRFSNAGYYIKKVRQPLLVCGGRICGFQPLREETPRVGKWGSANASPLLRAFQPVTCRFPMLLWLGEASPRPPLPETDLKCLGGICDAENVHYLRATRIPHALLVNFGRPALQYDTFDLDNLLYATSTETPNPCGEAAAPGISC